MTDLRQHPLPYDHIRHSPEDHYILAQQYNNIHPPSHHMLAAAAAQVHGQQQQQQQQQSPQELHHNNNNSAVYPQPPIEYNRDHPHNHHHHPMYHQLEGGGNNNHKGLHHANDPNGDYDETMSNNDDNSSMKDLSPGVESSKLVVNAHQMRNSSSAYADNCDMPPGQVNKSSANYDYAGNAIRARSFKDMQSPAESSEGTDAGTNHYMEGQEGEKDTGNGEVGNNLRTYPSSEDLNQTMSSEHGGEKITSGSDDEGE